MIASAGRIGAHRNHTSAIARLGVWTAVQTAVGDDDGSAARNPEPGRVCTTYADDAALAGRPRPPHSSGTACSVSGCSRAPAIAHALVWIVLGAI
jgi:hypothetical protein